MGRAKPDGTTFGYKKGDRARYPNADAKKSDKLYAENYDQVQKRWKLGTRSCGCLLGFSPGVRADYCVGKVKCTCCGGREDCALIFGETLCGDCLHGYKEFKNAPKPRSGARTNKSYMTVGG